MIFPNPTENFDMARRIAYWITTGLTAFVFLAGGSADIESSKPMTVKGQKIDLN